MIINSKLLVVVIIITVIIITVINITVILFSVFKNTNKPSIINKTPFHSVWKETCNSEESCKTVILNILLNIQLLLKERNVDIIPFFDTLLGLVRHKELLPWYDSVDFCIVNKGYSFLMDMKDDLAKRYIGIIRDKYCVKLYDLREPKIEGKQWSWPFINVFSYELKDDNVLIYNIPEISNTVLKINSSDFFPLQHKVIEGINISFPNNTENILENIYGEKWKDICISSVFNHREQRRISNVYKINCSSLKPPNNYNIFNNVWVINLDKRLDRWETCKMRLNNIGIKPKRYKAVDAKTPEFVQFYNRIPSPKISDGEVACYISHKKLWKLIYEQGLPYVLIFEDDLIFSSNFGKNDILSAISHSIGFNVIFLGHSGSTKPHQFFNKEYIFSNPITLPGSAYCMHAYIISRPAIEFLLAQPDNFTKPIDEHLYYYCHNNLCFLSKHVNYDSKNTFGNGLVYQDNKLGSNLRESR